MDPNKTIEKMVESGISRDTLGTLEFAGIDVKGWLRGFSSVEDSVRNSVAMLRQHPLLPRYIPVHGLVMHPVTGELEVVVDGSPLADDLASAGGSTAPSELSGELSDALPRLLLEAS